MNHLEANVNAPIDDAHRIALRMTHRIREWHKAKTGEVAQFDLAPMPADYDPRKDKPDPAVPDPLATEWRLR